MAYGKTKQDSTELGNADAFGEAVRQHQAMLLRVARNYLANPEDAADAVQEALILGYLHRGQLRDSARLASWLRQITVNTCKRLGRSLRPTLPLEQIERIGYDSRDAFEQRYLLKQALRCLTPDTSLTVQLYYQDGLSLQEIAHVQRVPETTIKSRLRNARARLRKELDVIMPQTVTDPTTSPATEAPDLLAQVLRRITMAGTLMHSALSPDGTVFVTGVALEVNATRFDARITAWQVATGDLLWSVELTSWFRTICFTIDGTQVVIATGLPNRRDGREGRLLFLDAATGAMCSELPTVTGALGLALSADGRYAATAHSEHYENENSHGDKGVIRIFDLASKETIACLEPHLNQVHALAFSPDSKTLASSAFLRDADPEAKDVWGGADVRLWDLETRQILHKLERPNGRGLLHNICFSPDGSLLVAPNGAEGEALVWEVATGKRIHTLPGSGAAVFALAYSPTGKLIAAGRGDSQISLYDAQTGKEVGVLSGEGKRLSTLAFHPDGTLLIAAHTDGAVRVWELGD
ncbi:MAG: sigma-70 family RNA polymerase sigma factor [Armatimonas sp.]